MADTMTKFGDHTPFESRSMCGGIQHRFKFENGYGASVVRHEFSYGQEQGLWELAVIGRDGGITYDTPITDDVVGRINETEVAALLTEIKNLP